MEIKSESSETSSQLKKTVAVKQWHVLYTKARNEKKVTADLTNLGFEVYCPLITTMRQWSDRKKKVSVPMFPSYVFVNISEYEREKILYHPAIIKFVYWLGKPALLREKEIISVKRIEEIGSGISVEQNDLLVGNYITIKDGIFKGLEGRVEGSDKHKVTIYLRELDMKISFSFKNT